MAHILVGGNPSLGLEVCELLRQWGHTFASFEASGLGNGFPTIDQCDAVILVSPNSDLQPTAGTAADQSPPAPLLLLGTETGSVLLSRGAQQVVNQMGPEGVDLKFALHSCLEKTGCLRGKTMESRQSRDRRGYLYFLGHELRSPLTAAKTALEVLQGELGGMLGLSAGDEGDSAEPPGREMVDHDAADRQSQLKMLEIALRNIKRLHRTVDWSQDLQELEAATPASQWSEVAVEELGGMLPSNASWELDKDLAGCLLRTDASLLSLLIGQVVRVLEYAKPGSHLRCAMSADQDRNRHLQLFMLAEEDDSPGLGQQITRTYLTPTAGGSDGSPRQELERLVQYVVSAPLLEQLQADIQVVQWEGLGAGVVLDLILSADGAETGSSDSHQPQALQPRALHTLA